MAAIAKKSDFYGYFCVLWGTNSMKAERNGKWHRKLNFIWKGQNDENKKNHSFIGDIGCIRGK